MSAKLLVLLLPALAHCRISINVKASDKNTQATVEYLGSTVDIITDKEAQTFGLSDSALKDAAQRFSGGRPGDVYLKSPTPWNDLYQRYGWSQVRRTLYPRNARILGIKAEPVVLTTQEFINNSSVKAKYNAGITQQVEDTVSNTWSKGGELQIGQEISYSVDVVFGEVGGTTSISYTSSWGEEQSKSKTVTVGSNSGVEVELDPGQAVVATLTATRGTMDIQVDYTASLDGDLACNYPDRHRGHYFWRYDLNAVQNAGNLRKTVDSTEIIKIGFYSDAKVVVNDRMSQATLASVDVKIF